MKTIVSSLAVCLLAGTIAIAAAPRQQQQQQQEPPQKPQPTEATLLGCLVQGSMPSVFILDNVKVTGGGIKESGMRYMVIAEGKDVDLRSHVNHEVELRGMVSTTTPPPTPPTEEKDLPTIRARELRMISSTCGV